jgi:membrane-bound lytic murein transglycosylase D
VTHPAPIALPTYIDPVPTPLGTSLQQAPKVDPIGLVIIEARHQFDRGLELYKDGFLQRAKDEFDGAIDLLLDSAALYPNNARLDAEINELASRINTLELAASKDGDGFTNQKPEHAAIDDLGDIPTFPAAVDPKLKKQVEEDVAGASHDLPIEINDRVLSFLDY